MKNLNKVILIVCCLFMINSYAQQHPTEKMKTTTVKKFAFEKDGKKIPYEIKVFENRNYVLKLDKKDKGQLNQDRVKSPAYVTKLIFINNDMDTSYDRYIVLRYEKFPDDSFELIPTKKGFGVKVDKKYVEYIMGEGVYYVNNEDKDFFVVDEFMTI